MNNNSKFSEEKKCDDKEEMIVVTGYKRSGTSLMMALVSKLGVELQYCRKFEAALRAEHGGKNDFYYEDSRLTAKPANQGETVWFEGVVKMFSTVVTHNVQQVPSELFNSDHVKVIWMRRDPAKIERSIRRYKKPGASYTGPSGVSSSTLEMELEVLSRLEKLHEEAIQKLPSVLTIEFDDLLSNPMQVAKDVANFLGKPFSPSMVDQYLQLVNPDKAESAAKPASSFTAASAAAGQPPVEKKAKLVSPEKNEPKLVAAKERQAALVTAN